MNFWYKETTVYVYVTEPLYLQKKHALAKSAFSPMLEHMNSNFVHF